MAATPKDRRQKLLESTSLNGIDFVEVASADQRTLRVHFVNHVALSGSVSNPTISGGETIATIAVHSITDATDWSADADGRPILTLTAFVAGDFSNYTLALKSTLLDAVFNTSEFSFKATCPSDLDCEAVRPPCPPEAGNPPPIDYLAKDFLSFRKALLDFSALRYPEWQERSEADFGMTFLEALAGLADDLSYTQDRVAGEKVLDTATQRRSIVRLARLVDYEPAPAISSSVLLQFNVTGSSIPAGKPVSGLGPDGQIIPFETGTGLADQTNYKVNPLWNAPATPYDQDHAPIRPYYWDDKQLCLKAGATEMWVVGHGFNFYPGQALLIDTQAALPADPPLREVVHLVIPEHPEEVDPLFLDNTSSPIKVTHITWDAKEQLQHNHDLSRTVLAGNLVPATQGQRFSESFAIETPPAGHADMLLAVVRTGANSMAGSFVPMYLYTLRQTPLTWLRADVTSEASPDIEVIETPPSDPAFAWTWEKNLLDADELETAFTLDRASYIPVARNSDKSVSYEYDGDSGDTIRFGDDVFGSIPEPGAVFGVTYRVTAGADGNLAADSITRFDPTLIAGVTAVTNPFPATGGADQESNESVRRLAPQRFRASQFRAVRPEDYVDAARSLDWVQRAGTVFRWTGSWLTVFTTADPLGSEQITLQEQLQLIRLLNRRRLAGYESYAPAPHYVSLDLEVYVCARSDAFQGEVKAAVLNTLSDVRNPDGSRGFFHPDNFTFGKALERSALEAAIQEAYGVAGVHSVLYRRRGVMINYVDMPNQVTVDTNDILRADNDLSLPERGSVRVYVDGGK
jgi:Baseplate J-like protein